MHRKHILATGGALIALALALPGIATAGRPAVSVRIEGLTKTLLPATLVHAGSGSITKGGTPAGKCPAASAAGALDAATHHSWTGSWDAKYAALSVTSIFGEAHPLTSKDYWSVWVNNGYAQSGICGIKLKAGEHLLFAAVPDTPQEYPIGLLRAGPAAGGVKVETVWYNSAGKAAPLPGVHVTGHGINDISPGTAIITIPLKAGHTVVLHGTEHGYIRAAALRVRG